MFVKKSPKVANTLGPELLAQFPFDIKISKHSYLDAR